MSDQGNIPVLTDLIEKGIEITMSDLGLDDDAPAVGGEADDIEIELAGDDSAAVDPLADNPALEQAIRRILDEHMELAWQEIRLAIQRELEKP